MAEAPQAQEQEDRMWEGDGHTALRDPQVKPKSESQKNDLERGVTCSDLFLQGRLATEWGRD